MLLNVCFFVKKHCQPACLPACLPAYLFACLPVWGGVKTERNFMNARITDGLQG
jgi:hypothetical protein